VHIRLAPWCLCLDRYGDFKYWTVRMTGVSVLSSSSASLSLCAATICYCIIDSGTSGIAVS